MEWLGQLERGALSIGVLIVVFSLVLYIKRTAYVKAVIFFWQKRLQWTRQEFIINSVAWD